MMIAIYYVLCGEAFKDLGADFYNNFNREKKINSHIKQLLKLGITEEEVIALTGGRVDTGESVSLKDTA